jgi:hemerythrin
MEWNENLATGVQEIDDQHKELISRINGVLDACNERKGKEVVEETLDFLGAYVIEHFRAEERLQQRYNYPTYDLHKDLHDQFIERLKELKNKFSEEGANLTLVLQVNRVIVEWFIAHINKVDKEFAKYMRDNII